MKCGKWVKFSDDGITQCFRRCIEEATHQISNPETIWYACDEHVPKWGWTVEPLREGDER